MRLFLLLLSLPLRAQFSVNTVAGGMIPSGIPAQNAYLQTISGPVWDAAGNLVFCDLTNNEIRRVRTDGIIETIAGTGIPGFAGDGGSALKAQLDQPRYPRYDSAGNLYFWDEGNARIRRIDPKGIVTTVAGNGLAYSAGQDLTGPATARSLDFIQDLSVDRAGNIYFVEPIPGRVRSLTWAGNLEVLVAGLINLSSVAADSSGNVYILDGTNTLQIQRVSSTGVLTTFLQFPSSHGAPIQGGPLTIDAKDNLYMFYTGALLRFAPDASMTTLISGPSQDPSAPSISAFDISVDAEGNIGFGGFLPNIPYWGRNIIGEFTAQGQYKILAGGTPQPAPDGTALPKSWLLGPAWIAFDHIGNLYIAETSACLIRKIDTNGVLSTFAGSGKCGYPAPSGDAKTADLVLPTSIAVDSQNRVWVADDYLNLYSIAQDGTISFYPGRTPVGGGKGQLAIDSKDRVYILGSASLYRLLPDGTLQAIVTPPTSPGVPPPGSGLTGLTGIGTDPSGTFYFSDSFSLYRMNDDASFVKIYTNTSIQTPFSVNAAGVAWDGACFSGPKGTSCLDGLDARINGTIGTIQSAFAPDGSLYLVHGNEIVKLIFPSTPAPAPVIATGGIVNAVSYQGGAIASGELISIFGSNFASGNLQVNVPGNNAIPFWLGRTQVLFDGLPGAITAVTPNQINVFVPGDRQLGAPAHVVVQVDDAVSLPVTVSMAEVAPGLAASDASGSGPGAILNQDGSVNSQANPARSGSIVALFGTGLGQVMPDIPPNALTISTPYPTAQNPVTVSIGGAPAPVLYAGSAPMLPSGVFQVNAQIPTGLKSGAVPVSVTAAGISTAQSITVWVAN